MYQRVDPGRRVAAITTRQAGVLSERQLRELGAPPGASRRWKQGWQPLADGLYCTTEPTWLSWCWAGILRAGDDAVVGGRAACHLLGITDQPPDRITVWHPRPSTLVPFGNSRVSVRFRRGPRDGLGSPPRSRAERSIIDAAGESAEDVAVSIALRALVQGITTPGRLVGVVGDTARVRHRGVLEALCSGEAEGIESILEWWFLQAVIRAHGLPEHVRQVGLAPRSRSDCHWPEYGVVAELDGRLGHAGNDDVFRDMSRDNHLVEEGLATLRYGSHDLAVRACAVAAQVHRVLRRHGYAGPLRRCRHCR